MKKLMVVAGLAVVFFIQSCVMSIHPLYTKDTIVTRPLLEGVWKLEDEDTVWSFETLDDDPAYFMKIDGAKKSGYQSVLVELGGNLFMDLYPHGDYEVVPDNDLIASHLLAVHTFAKVTAIEENRLEIALFDYDWLKEQITRQRIRIKHEETEDNDIVLTASTQELQQFMEKYGSESEAFQDALIFHRQL